MSSFLALPVPLTHQRPALGSPLIGENLGIADEGGAKTYLDFSAVGVPLYLKHGFK